MLKFIDVWMVSPFFSLIRYLFTESPVEEDASATCPLCNRTITFSYIRKERYDFFSMFDKLKELNWCPLWIVKNNFVCPECNLKLKKGLVPGVGIVLVTKEMFEKGKAFPLDSFEAQNEKF